MDVTRNKDVSRRNSLLNTPLKSRISRSRTSLGQSGLNLTPSRIGKSSVHIVLKSAHNNAERFGLPVPVLVEDAFNSSDKNTLITARVSECGWAWVVCGRKLFLWQFQDIQDTVAPKQKVYPVCHELRLPQSDLAHRAELVSVFLNKMSAHPSCVAVSPEGMVRYWPDITQNHTSVDQHVNLHGEECDSLVDAGHLGCIFVTTSCTVVLVQYKQGRYEHEISFKRLRTPGSWLGGIGKRVSSIFFGPMTTDSGNETRIIRLLATPGFQQKYNVYVLAGLVFQKWELNEPQPEELTWSLDLRRPLIDGFRSHNTHWDLSDYGDIDVWVLDMQQDKEGVLMLCAATNLHMGPQMYYGMAAFSTSGNEPPTSPKQFLKLQKLGFCTDNNTAEVLQYRFILCGQNVYIYNSKTITVIKPEETDQMEFLGPRDHIFSGCNCLHIPIFFSRKHGLLAIVSNDPDLNSSLAPSSHFDTSVADVTMSSQQHNLSIYSMDAQQICDAHKDTVGQLKAAFILHVKNQLSDCYDMVNNLFPPDMPVLPVFDSSLDTVAIKLVKDILDDIPAGDTRWHQNGMHGLGSSNSMLVLQQVKDKQKVFNLYITFLKESGLWNKLTGVTIRNGRMATIHLLAEYSEKITAAVVMKTLPLNPVLEEAVEKAVTEYHTKPENGLSRQDIFYREISRIHEGILWLAKVCQEASHSQMQPEDVAQCIQQSNEIMITLLNEVLQHRHQNADMFALNEISKSMRTEFLPWTAANGPEGILDALKIQLSLSENFGVKTIGDGDLKDKLFDEMVLLADFILDGKKKHLATVRGNKKAVLEKKYFSLRTKIIAPLVDLKAYEKAAILAEKYIDFEILMRICEDTGNEKRMDVYMERFKDLGFAEFLYNWFQKKRQTARLLERHRKLRGRIPEGHEKLGNFLAGYPSFAWIHQVFNNDYASAAETLRPLAEGETDMLSRQKTMLSISKLAKLAAPPASDRESHVQDIDKRLELISFQAALPDYVLEHYGFDSNNPPVIQPKDMIALYISPIFTDAAEIEFQRALSIAENFIEDEIEKVELGLEIWRAALLRDRWDYVSLDDPIECLKNTLFFRLVDFCIMLGLQPERLLPPIDMLLDDPASEDLRKNKNFEPLLKMGYEHFHRTQMI